MRVAKEKEIELFGTKSWNSLVMRKRMVLNTKRMRLIAEDWRREDQTEEALMYQVYICCGRDNQELIMMDQGMKKVRVKTW